MEENGGRLRGGGNWEGKRKWKAEEERGVGGLMGEFCEKLLPGEGEGVEEVMEGVVLLMMKSGAGYW